ncbi:hypothetical protein LOZ66_004446 [Ophidiomyces ophidiicola]|nr:hypothetical protein LOZ65_006078 [Ophidiomyces ophidiicola]KAI1936937.1 hypothetical protein LOZ66_004446 [Ophidiomyces ophidiicola]
MKFPAVSYLVFLTTSVIAHEIGEHDDHRNLQFHDILERSTVPTAPPRRNTVEFPPPQYPEVGLCKQMAADGAKLAVQFNTGKIREIGCYRNCTCPGTSDHCCGLAVDLMCTTGLNVRDRDDYGRAIGEWAVKYRFALNLKYVIWGRKIWNPTLDPPSGWEDWRLMEDRGSDTQNHWDHVHISFNEVRPVF